MCWDVARELDRAHGLPRSSVFETLYRTDAWRDIERGIGDARLWAEAAHAELERRAGRPLPRLHETWRGAQRAIAANVELVRALRPGYKLSVLSNADLTLRARLEREGLDRLFDDVVVSAEVGLAKPDPAVFRLAVERLGLETHECVFVDDWDDNVEAARRVGLQAVCYRAHKGDDLRALLAAAGIAVSDR